MNVARPALRKTRIEMVPLIDSFFLLLAFFISSMLSMSVMKGLPIDLASASASSKLEPRDVVVVTVAANGVLQLDGQLVTVEELSSRLRAKEPVSALYVAVRADRFVPAGQLLPVLGAIRAAGVARVGLVTQLAAEPDRH